MTVIAMATMKETPVTRTMVPLVTVAIESMSPAAFESPAPTTTDAPRNDMISSRPDGIASAAPDLADHTTGSPRANP